MVSLRNTWAAREKSRKKAAARRLLYVEVPGIFPFCLWNIVVAVVLYGVMVENSIVATFLSGTIIK